jgi:LDH2 family malate/lactate/ureidoglycolate dehydrogenase
MAAFSGDPPISFAFPSAEETSIVLDGGASVFGTYHGDGFEDLPERIPATFFKSMGFIATATLIGGALTGFTAPDSDAVEKRWPGALMGGTVIALDPARLGGAELFAAEVDRYVRDLRGTHDPLPGTDQVRVPGQLEEERAEAYRRDGIAYGEPEQASLRALAERLSLRLPWDEV